MGPTGGATSITVTSGTGCAWTATTSSTFVTILAGGTGSGTGTVVLNVASASGVNRTATATIAGQTFTVSQTGANLNPSFSMFDPASQTDATNTCRLRGATAGNLSICQFASTSSTLGANQIIWYIWKVQYTYGSTKTLTQASATSTFSVGDVCGQNPNSVGGFPVPLSVSLTVLDNNGNQATATSGVGNQPALQFAAYTCGS